MSSALIFLLIVCHLCLMVMWAKYSFCHLLQNCSARYWTLCHLFRAYKSYLTKFLGGGSSVDVFIWIKWFGIRGSMPLGSLIVSTVSGQLFTIAISLYRKVLNMPWSNLPAADAKTLLITLLTVLFWCSHTPPCDLPLEHSLLNHTVSQPET